MVALIGWVWGISDLKGYIVWFLAGLVFSLVGDIMLILPRERFIAAWFAFLLAHISYVIGFNPNLPPMNFASLALAVLVFIVAFRLTQFTLTGLKLSGNLSLKIPIILYSIVISLMLLSSLLTLVRIEWLEGPSLMVSAGAILFFISDFLLAMQRYVTPIRYSPVIIMITYHVGQVLIVSGACLQYVLLV